MNWFVKNYGIKVTDMMDPCEHLQEGDKAHVVHREMDSFGPVGEIALCEECENKRIEEKKASEEIETEFCFDCNAEKVLKEMREWRPYDFYAPQGDEPLNICEECWEKPKHQKRVALDAANELKEFGCDNNW